MKNVLEFVGTNFVVKPAILKKYAIDSLKFEDIFAGAEPEFQESLRKTAKKGTLDGWLKPGKENGVPVKAAQAQKPVAPKPPKPEKPLVKKQTPEEIEAEMKRMREQQAKFKQGQEQGQREGEEESAS